MVSAYRVLHTHIAVSAIFAATHDGKKKLGTVFLAEWIFLKTALSWLRCLQTRLWPRG